jgi:hypothetical protein
MRFGPGAVGADLSAASQNHRVTTSPATRYKALKKAYQHADPEGMLLALESRRELREAR